MPLFVIDFTYLDGRDGDTVVKVLAAVDFQSNRVASYVFNTRSASGASLPESANGGGLLPLNFYHTKWGR